MKNKGITLVALIVTIIVLLILAGITISQLTGNGLFENAKKVKEEEFKSKAKESIQLALIEIAMNKNGEKIEWEDLIDKEKGLNSKDNNIILNEENVWTGIYSDKIMQISFSIDSSNYEVIFNSEVLNSEITLNDYIIYDANGGENAPEKQTKLNNIISTFIPTRENYVFVGWGKSSDSTEILYKGGESYTGEDKITLYALWVEKIECLESDGLHYIDTGFYPNQDTSIEFVAVPTEIVENRESAWFGSRNTGSGLTTQRAYTFWEIDNRFMSYYGNQNNNNEDCTISEIEVLPDTKYTIYMNKNVINVNGEKYLELTYETFTSPSTLTLFGVKTYTSTVYNEENSVDYRMASLKLYSCKIWDNDKLVRDYVPIKKGNNTLCLLEKITKTIYYNKGSGEFVAGE